ncbi:symmetrical bis(5'-nucleosyl)-tetraphosphatase [Oceanicoccus sagamiensis]|uniref:bis(5'-nucleosyl)-tetraphosphatase (symmetrical) n=1 Tax=Oceanicoccus sagamiensis TaxID=716816 RepID=A0A1X9ND13_9GAMM|nr:symmetrical bis(5'-nucleosyl)-tetraphosphatase [Oceanicoccus sagamiensis]ARN74302.1 bis(5'-nucleosyl)-tetraphosphatase (symmetrical) [Oceanicoccus sagamiensis]
MTRYAVGDVQGCLAPLQCLLKEVAFDPAQDQLWLAGDLINRGPASLDTLRFIKELGDCTRIVLGNHDLHFLAVAHGTRNAGKSDTFDEILNASDCQILVQWLQQQHLIYNDPSHDYTMVHAGIPPIWTVQQASQLAHEVEQVLRGETAADFFSHMYGNEPAVWNDQLEGWTRLRVITNYLTRMRFCTVAGELDFEDKLATIDKPDFKPWFSYPATSNQNIIFGHWAALEGKADNPHVFALDTGCVWGHALTLMNLDTQQMHRCDCAS